MDLEEVINFWMSGSLNGG